MGWFLIPPYMVIRFILVEGHAMDMPFISEFCLGHTIFELLI